MARILIFEPHSDIRALLELVVRRLGHDAIVVGANHGETPEVDVAVIEPGDGAGLPLAEELRKQDRPVVFTSIFPPDERSLDLCPVAYLVKPFSLYDLENALGAALAQIPRTAAV